MNKIYLSLLCSFLSYGIFAQIPFQTSSWKKYRKEIYFNAGTSGFLGDLGGAEGVGTTNSFKDFNPSAMRYSLALGGRYRLNEFLNINGKLSQITVSGDDALSKDLVRKNRNLNFKSNIIELSTRMEGWPSGLRRTPGKCVYGKPYRGFESLSLRHLFPLND